jgi:hypothetical protein
LEKITSGQIKQALARKHGDREFFLTEVKNGPSYVATGELLIFDAVAIYKSWSRPQIRGYEIKVSRSDFLRDAKYSQYLTYCHEFYFVTPTGMVQRQEVEENIGLIWYNSSTGSLTTKKKAIWRNIEIDPLMLLYIIMNRLDSDRLPFYSSKAEYWRDWYDNKISNRELGYHVRSKLLEKLREVERVKDELDSLRRYQEAYEKVRDVMRKHGIRAWTNNADNVLDEALSAPYPKELDTIRDQLSDALRSIDMLKWKGGSQPE